MTESITSRINYQDIDGLKLLFPETKASIVSVGGYENLQDLVDKTYQVKVADNSLLIRDKLSGEWETIASVGDNILPPEDMVTPPLNNVSGLSATVSGYDVIVKWSDPNDINVSEGDVPRPVTVWQSTKLVYKVGSIPVDINDGTLAVENTVRNQYSEEGYSVIGLEKDVEIFFKLFPIDNTGRIVNSDDNSISIIIPSPVIAEPSITDGLIAGDINAGFFGEIPSSEFITPTDLALELGVSTGISQYEDTPWLKFILDGNILFTTKKPIRSNISWDSIDAVGATKGTTTIQVSGKTYKVRLFKGALTDPYSYDATDRGAKGSEWNRLMLPIHINARDKSWVNSIYAEDDIPYWGIDYTDEDLMTDGTLGNGAYSWCQETPSEFETSRPVRGGNGVEYSSKDVTSSTNHGCGWRPVLELVQP